MKRNKAITQIQAAVLIVIIAVAAVGVYLSLPILFPPKEKVKVTFQHCWWMETEQTRLNDFLEEFQRTHPNIEVEPVYVGWGDTNTWMETSAMTGELADICMSNRVDWVGAMSYLFADLSEVLPSSVLDDIYDYAKAYGTDKNGRLFALYFTNQHGIHVYIRTDWFSQIGIDVPNQATLQGPEWEWSWTEFEDVLARLRDVMPEGKYPWLDMNVFARYLLLTSDNGLDYAYIGINEQGKPVSTVLDPEFKEGLEFAIKMFDNKWQAVESMGYTPEMCFTRFVEGDAAMFCEGQWFGGFLKSNYPDLVTWAEMPRPYGPGRSSSHYTFEPHFVLVSNVSWWKADSAKRQAISTLLTEMWQDLFPNIAYYDEGILSTSKSAMASDPFVNDARIQLMQSWVMQGTPVRPAFKNYLYIRNGIVKPICERILLGELELDEGLVLMDTQIKPFL